MATWPSVQAVTIGADNPWRATLLSVRVSISPKMGGTMHVAVFRLDDLRYALPLAAVEHAVRAVEVTPLPHAPAIVLGVINVQGRVLPVINLRRRFHLPEREIGLADWFLIAHTTRHAVVLVVDELEDVIERPQIDVVPSTQIVPGLGHTQGMLKLDDGLVSILDLEDLLSVDEAQVLDRIA